MKALCFYIQSFVPGLSYISSDPWLQLARNFEFDKTLVIDRTRPDDNFKPCVSGDIPAESFKTFEEVYKAYPNYKYVFVAWKEDEVPEDKKLISILDYEHPEDNVIYCFGSDTRINSDRKDICNGDWITLKGLSDRFGLWSWQAAGIVLWERRRK